MKRVILHTPEDVRRASAAIARWAVNGEFGRKPPDPVHEWVTEGRRTQWERAHAAGQAWAQGVPYSSCGDLAHADMWLLGCRDERLVNRTHDGGTVDWSVGANISRLVGSGAYRTWESGGHPQLGDILHVAKPDHVAVLASQWPIDGHAMTCDYGGPYGVMHECEVFRGLHGVYVRGRRLMGWLDVTRIIRRETAIVPDDFEGCEVDENPYEEGVTVPGLAG